MPLEWDKKKAASNLKKHSVSFDEAATVFRIYELPSFLIRNIQAQRSDGLRLVTQAPEDCL